MFALLLSALILGLGGSLHCVGMCGPLVMGMPFQQVQKSKKLFAVLLYMLSKAMAYGLLGILVGLLGRGFVLMDEQQHLSIIIGIVIIAFAFMPMLLKKVTLPFLLQKQFNTVYSSIIQSPKLYYFSILGFLNGLLPCGLVYTALAAASVTALPINAFAFMFLFGVGTMPALISIVLLKNEFNINHKRYFNKISMVISVALGMLLILRGMNLNIPYISPSLHDGIVKSCCHKN